MLTRITFFERFESDILSGNKTITIRDNSEKDFQIGSIIPVATFEQDRQFCTIKIISITAIAFTDINQHHAEQENMSLNDLKNVIKQIYPSSNELFVIEFGLISRS